MAIENKNGHQYTNRVKVALRPGVRDKVKEISDKLDVSESSIVADAVDYYLKNLEYIKTGVRQSNHSY